MHMSTSSRLAGLCLVSEVTAADTRAIEAGLHELWRMAEGGEAGGALVRAASMTLLLPVEQPTDPDDLAPLLDALAATHPFRAILLVSDEDVDRPRARLCSHTRGVGEGELTRYWEDIRIVSPPRSLHQVMSAVASLSLPNLPVHTWWDGEPDFEGDLYHHVVEVADRILVDSSRFGDPAASLPGLAAAIEVAHESIAFADLSWTRLTPWRLLIAELFDAPADQALLDSIEHVHVEYARQAGGAAAQALLLVGWLASRLGWEPRAMRPHGSARGEWSFEMVDGVRPVEVVVAAVDGAAEPRGGEGAAGLRSVSIRAAEGDRRAEYTVERCDDGEEARTVAEVDGARREGIARLPASGWADLLREELGRFATDRIYGESLSLVARVFDGRKG
jgi:glucose-6-phosphate dehydrogenase assembly protein OpcA